jgi:hypothetical protein
MTRNIRGRLDRLERSAPAHEGGSIFTTGAFWRLIACEPGPYTPAELAEWGEVLREAEEALAAGDPVARRLAGEIARGTKV